MQILLHTKYRTLIRAIFAFFHSIIIELVIFSHFFEFEYFDLQAGLG